MRNIPFDIVLYILKFIRCCPFCKKTIFSKNGCKKCNNICCNEICSSEFILILKEYNICRWCYFNMMIDIQRIRKN